MDKQKDIIIAISAAFLLLAGFDGWPYDFFVLLRFIVCASAVYLAWLAYKTKQEKWIWAYGIIAVLFNPFLPLHFSRSAWAGVDITTAIFLVVSGFFFQPYKKKIAWDKIDRDTLINSEKIKITLDEMKELSRKDLVQLGVYLELSLVTKNDDAEALGIINYNINKIKNYLSPTKK